MKNILGIFIVSSVLHLQNAEAQFNCPDSLIYGVTPLSTQFIRVTNPKLPLSATNPSNTIIPNPAPGMQTALSLNTNLNSGSPSPTLYSVLWNGNYCYWNGTTWVDTGHSCSHITSTLQSYSLGGCKDYIYSYKHIGSTPIPLSYSVEIFRYDGTSSDSFLISLVSTEHIYHDIVTDCNCNFFLLSNASLKKYSPSGVLLSVLPVNGLPNNGGSGFAIIGDQIYATSASDIRIGTIMSTGISFYAPTNLPLNYGASDLASCPSTSIISTAATINSGSIGCNPSSINLAVNATLSPLSYNWSGPGIGTSVPGSSLQNVSQAGTYTCAITQAGCDYVLATLVSTVVSNVSNINPQIFPAAQVCFANVTQLYSSINTPTYSYQWAGSAITGGASTPSINLNAAGIYSVTVTNTGNGCFGIATASVLESPLLSMGISSPTLCVYSTEGKDKAILSYSGAPNYTLLVSQGFSVNFNVSQPVVLFQTQPFASAGSAGSATLLGSNGVCTSSILTNFSVMPVTIVTVATEKTKICKDATVTLTAQGAKNYSFSPLENVLSINQNTAIIQVSKTTVLSAFGIDEHGCKTIPGDITVEVLPPHLGNLEYNQLLCAPACPQIRFVSNAVDNNKIVASWTVTGSGVYNGSQSFRPCFAYPGNYSIHGILTDSIYGCSNAVSFSITVLSKPEADFIYEPQKPIENNDEVKFISTDIDSKSHYRWFYKAPMTIEKEGVQISQLFEDAGVYPVALLVRNTWGCSDTIIKTIKVEPDFAVYVPNAFSPNADERNDIFKPVIRDAIKYNLKIYDRWGHLIFESTEIENGWDGTNSGGVNSKPGVYAWRIEVTSLQGESRSLSGHVTLVK